MTQSKGKTEELEWPVTLTGIWCFLHSTCELIHTFVHKRKNCNKDAKNIRCHHIKLVKQDLCTPALHKVTFVWEKDSFIKWNIMLMYHCTDLRTLLVLTRKHMEHQHRLWLLFTFWPAVLLFLHINYNSRSAFVTQVLSISTHHSSVVHKLCPHSLHWMTAHHHTHQAVMFHVQHTLFW